MSENGCLRDGFFNRIQIDIGGIQDAFPNGIGPMDGLSVTSNQNINMGNNQINDVSDPTDIYGYVISPGFPME